MFALKDGISGGTHLLLMRSVVSVGIDGIFILPQFLRWMSRFVVSLFDDTIKVPNYFGTIGMLSFLALTGIYGVVVGDHSQEVAKAMTSAFGFRIEKINIVGNSETLETDILSAIHFTKDIKDISLIELDANEIRNAIITLPWVESVDVRKMYPSTLHVSIHERRPFAIWQHDENLVLIDNKGDMIVPFSQRQPVNLPLVIGDGAGEKARAFVDQVSAYPQLAEKVYAYIRVANRRWDLILKNGVRIMLPESGVDDMFAEIERLDQEEHFLSRDIVAVDMRIEDRIGIRLGSHAMESREQMLNKNWEKQVDRVRKRV